MSAPEIAGIGLGGVDQRRLAASIAILVQVEGLPRTPTPAEIFDPRYLPPLADRPTAVR